MKSYENYVEPYAKEKNLIQLSLFYFGKGKPEKTVSEWFDNGECRLECVCKYGVPGSFEQDCHTAIMRLWLKQGRPKAVRLNYSDIARELHLEPKDWVSHIKQSLKRLAQARYEFTRCFVISDENNEIKQENLHFSLFDSASLFEYEEGKSKRKSESYIIFADEIQRNLEAKYYQLLDMVWYRSLPEGLSRRLYEYLAKRQYHNINGKFIISEEVICRWLPIKDKNTTTRRRRLNRISNVLVKEGYLSEYEFNVKKKQCIFTYMQENLSKKNKSDTEIQRDTCDIKEEITTEVKQDYLEALKWIDSIPYFHSKRKDEVANLEMKKIRQLYPKIKAKYEEKANQGKAPKAGWVYRAFMEGWNFPDQIEKQNREKEIKEKKEKIKRQKADALEFIEKNGGTDNLVYKGQTFDLMDDYGLYLINVNILEHWDEINLDLFELISEEEC